MPRKYVCHKPEQPLSREIHSLVKPWNMLFGGGRNAEFASMGGAGPERRPVFRMACVCFISAMRSWLVSMHGSLRLRGKRDHGNFQKVTRRQWPGIRDQDMSQSDSMPRPPAYHWAGSIYTPFILHGVILRERSDRFAGHSSPTIWPWRANDALPGNRAGRAAD